MNTSLSSNLKMKRSQVSKSMLELLRESRLIINRNGHFHNKYRSSKTSVDGLKDKISEYQNIQEQLTIKCKEYDEVVRSLNKQIKSLNKEVDDLDTRKEKREEQLKRSEFKNKAFEEELYKKNQMIIERQSTIKKLEKELSSGGKKGKNGKGSRPSTNGTLDPERMQDELKEKDSQIEVYADMIEGMKTQLKQKDLDQYRLKSKIVSLQTQLGIEEDHANSEKYGCGVDHDKSYTKRQQNDSDDDDKMSLRSSASNFSKATPKSLNKAKAPKAEGGDRYVQDAAYLKSPLRASTNGGVQTSKPDFSAKKGKKK